MYGMYFLFVVFLYCILLQLTKVEGLLLPFLYIHTCVIFNKCIQTLKNDNNNSTRQPGEITYSFNSPELGFTRLGRVGSATPAVG